MLSPDQIEHLPSSLSENLVRIGTVGDGSCFFHSILRAVKSKYMEMTPHERSVLAYQIRKELADRLTLQKYLSLGEGAVASNNFMMLLRPRLDLYFKDKIPEKELDIMVAKTMDNAMESFKKKFIQELSKRFPTEKYEENEHLVHLFHQTLYESYENYKTYLGTGVFSVSEDIIDYVSNLLELNIYFISNKNIHQVYRFGHGDKIYGNHPCVIVFCIDNAHYELVGKVFSTMKPGVLRVQTMFDPKDPLIQSMTKI